MTDDGHTPDEDLERDAIGALTDEEELAALEEYLLLRGSCIGQPEDAEADAEAMREALKRLQEKQRKGE